MKYKRINVNTESHQQMHNSFGNTAAISKGIRIILAKIKGLWHNGNTASADGPEAIFLNVAILKSLKDAGEIQGNEHSGYRDDSLDGYQGLGEHTGDCIKNTLRDNVMGS